MYGIVRFTGNGVNTRFNVVFTMGFLRHEYIQCRVGNEVNHLGDPAYRDLEWDSPTSSWVTVLGDPPPYGSTVEFKRVVPKTYIIHTFTGANGGPMSDVALDENSKQLMMALHEIYDGGTGLLENIISETNVKIETVVDIEDVGVVYDAATNTFIFRIRMGEIAVSDALDGTRTAEDLVAASEAALGVVNKKVDDFIEAGLSDILEVSPTRSGLAPAFGLAPIGSMLTSHYTESVWRPAADVIKETGLIPRVATYTEVMTGVINTSIDPLRHPFVDPVQFVAAHKAMHVMQRSVLAVTGATKTLAKAAYVQIIGINGGQGGGTSGGALGPVTILPTMLVPAGTKFTATVGAGGAGTSSIYTGGPAGDVGGTSFVSAAIPNYGTITLTPTIYANFIAAAGGGGVSNYGNGAKSGNGLIPQILISGTIPGAVGVGGTSSHSNARGGGGGAAGYLFPDETFDISAGNGVNVQTDTYAGNGSGGKGFGAGGGGASARQASYYGRGGAGARGCVILYYWEVL